jgi:hypothetical protein
MALETVNSFLVLQEKLRKDLLEIAEEWSNKKRKIEEEISEVKEVENEFKHVYSECFYRENKSIEQWEFKNLNILNAILLAINRSKVNQKHKKGLYKAIKEWVENNKNLDNEE